MLKLLFLILMIRDVVGVSDLPKLDEHPGCAFKMKGATLKQSELPEWEWMFKERRGLQYVEIDRENLRPIADIEQASPHGWYYSRVNIDEDFYVLGSGPIKGILKRPRV